MVLPVYYAALGTLALFGLHRLILLLVLRLVRAPAAPAVSSVALPSVTVQLPIYNERYVAPRLLAAVLDFDYPAELLEIQILDDSTDDTGERIQAVLEEAGKNGRPLPAVHHLRRREREGFKAGALAAGMAAARGELIAIFDADFTPEPDFLRRAVPAFADPELALVQARWGHRNRADSLLACAQAVLLDAHFLVEQEARYRSGCFFNFNGTAGVWRRRAIEESGGWQFDTLTEDLDLSYRAQLAGWRFMLRNDLLAPADLPGRVNDFKSQQHRWARGTAQTMRKLLGRILRSPVRLRIKLAATAHLLSGVCYPLLVLLGLLLLPAILLRQESPHLLLWIDAPLFLLGTVAVAGCYVAGQIRAGLPLHRACLLAPLAMSVGIGLSLHNAAAVVTGLFRRGGVFARTPKVPLDARSSGAESPRAGSPGESELPSQYRSNAAWSLWGEAALALYFWVAIAAAGWGGRWWSLPFLYLFAQGYSLMAFGGLGGALPRR